MQEWLKNNDILMYSTHIEGKPVIAGRFMKTSKSKIFKKKQVMVEILIIVIWIN